MIERTQKFQSSVVRRLRASPRRQALLAATRAHLGSDSPPRLLQAERPLPDQLSELHPERAASKVAHNIDADNSGADRASLAELGIDPIPDYSSQSREEATYAVSKLGLDELPSEEWRGRLVFREELDDIDEETQKCWCVCLLYENDIDHRISTWNKMTESVKNIDARLLMSLRDEMVQMIRIANKQRYMSQIELLQIRESAFVSKFGLEGYESPIVGGAIL
jgi:hypothetical protein